MEDLTCPNCAQRGDTSAVYLVGQWQSYGCASKTPEDQPRGRSGVEVIRRQYRCSAGHQWEREYHGEELDAETARLEPFERFDPPHPE